MRSGRCGLTEISWRKSGEGRLASAPPYLIPFSKMKLNGHDDKEIVQDLLRTLYGVMDALDSADDNDPDAIRRIKRCGYANDARVWLYREYHYFRH